MKLELAELKCSKFWSFLIGTFSNISIHYLVDALWIKDDETLKHNRRTPGGRTDGQKY